MKIKRVSKYLTAAILASVFISTGSISMAEESIVKTTGFELKQDYDACAFDITTEMTGTFDVKLYSKGNEDKAYIGRIEGGNSCTINVENVNSGVWQVEITYVLDDDQNIEVDAATVIGKIKINAKAIDKTAFSVGNVSVARDIVGLDTYFKDDAVVVEWTDTSCGNVNVAIVDTKTSQILDKETVKGNYYEFELPELTDEISVNVVPSTSANITGANSQFTMPVINNPNAKVIYEDVEYVNTDTIPVNVELENAYSLLFFSNGAEVQQTGTLTAGTYTYDIPVEEGLNNIQTFVIDADHNMRSTSYTVTRDSIKPALTLDMEYDGLSTYDDIAVITGTIKDYETFMINETVPVVAGDGSFKAEYILKDGINELNIKATDIAGNETVYVASITKLIKQEPQWKDYIMPGIGIFVVIIFMLSFIIKKVRPSKEETDTEKKDKLEKDKNKNDDKAKKKKHKPLSKKQKDILDCVGVGVAIYFVFSYLIIWGNVPTESMAPTFNPGDYIISNGLAYVNHEPQRGDVIIFDKGSESLVKRVIGIPGDDIMFIDGYIYINGQLCYEEYISSDVETNCAWDFFDIPDGCYFVMGDNRENSYDSRYWDNPYVNIDDIEGKVMVSIPVSQLIDAVKSIVMGV
ncbi:MAG: signal peptidase I [Lachnospiraceae bacterium]|nr:signal peptidase I [Lachnospiraceae bacterium]